MPRRMINDKYPQACQFCGVPYRIQSSDEGTQSPDSEYYALREKIAALESLIAKLREGYDWLEHPGNILGVASSIDDPIVFELSRARYHKILGAHDALKELLDPVKLLEHHKHREAVLDTCIAWIDLPDDTPPHCFVRPYSKLNQAVKAYKEVRKE